MAGLAGAGLLAGVLGGAAPELDLQVDTSPLEPAVKQSTSYAPVIKKVSPSVVNIYTTKMVEQRFGLGANPFSQDPILRFFFPEPSGPRESQPRMRRESNLGSAVIVTRDGYLLTNHHVVEGADEIKVAIPSSRKEYDAQVVGSDPQTDIAVLKIEDADLPAATMSDSDLLEIGDTVLAIGNPFGVGQAVTVGIVSAKERGMGLVDYEDFIQTDASINPGNSGGAMIDAQGRLVGINTAILSRTGGNQGIGFAVPINLARTVLGRIVSEGKMSRGYLGVYIQPVTPGLARMFKLDDEQGALVGGVIAESPAEKAGVQEGDVIVTLNGEAIKDSRDLRFKVAQIRPGTEVTMGMIREGERKEFKVELDLLSPDDLRPGSSRRPAEPEVLGGALEGVEVGELTSEARNQFGVPSREEGVLVKEVAETSAAYEAGLRGGHVILSLNRNKTTSPREVLDLNRKAGNDPVLLHVWTLEASRYVLIEPEAR